MDAAIGNSLAHHPRNFAVDPDSYPLGLNALDFIGAFNPANDPDDQITMTRRKLMVLEYWEMLIRHDKAVLKADRAAARETQAQESGKASG